MIRPVSMASVSNVRFCAQQDAANPLEREGAYAKKTANSPVNEPAVEDKKKSSTGKKLLIGAGVIVAAAVALAALSRNKVLLKVLPEAELKDLAFYSPKKIGHYLATAGEKIASWTYDPIVKLIKGKDKADDVVDLVEEIVE